MDKKEHTISYGFERERTGKAYNLDWYDELESAGPLNLPILKTEKIIPDDLIGFNYALTTKKRDTGIHFFLDDYQFERIWKEPERYFNRLKEFQCVLTPDFSLYLDMPVAMKIWNVYRSRLIGQAMQSVGIKVIPTLQWAEPATFDFAFDGIERGGTVAVSTVGVMRDKEAQEIWNAGMSEAIMQIEPSMVLLYGVMPKFDFGDIPVKHYETRKGWNK